MIPLYPVDRPRPIEPYQVFILSSLVLAIAGGFAFGLLISLSRAGDWGWDARSSELVQSHGQLQILGFAGLYVMGMGLRLLPRFSGLHLRFQSLLFPMWGLTVAGLIVRAFVQPWLSDDLHVAVMVGTQIALLAAGVCFFLIVAGTLLTRDNHSDATGLFFFLGAALFLAQALAGAYATIQGAADDARLLSYLPDTAIVYLQLAGFVLAFIGGVSGRAIPTMVGQTRAIRTGKAAALVQASAVLTLAAALLWIEYVDYSLTAVRLADVALIALGPAFLLIALLPGVFRPASRLRPASRPHFWLVRTAFAWLAFAGLLASYFGAKALAHDTLPGLFEVDAIRHSLGIGLITTLIVGMSLLIVPEFAGQRMNQPDQALVSFVLLGLLNGAAALRVATALAGMHWTAETRGWLMAASGVLAETAMIVFALSFLELFVSGRLPPPDLAPRAPVP